MDDALPMRVRDRVGDGDHVRQQRQPLVERARAGDHLLERVAADQLHRVERLARRPAARLVDRHDRRVLQPRGDARLAAQALLVAVAQDLQCDLAPKILVERRVDDAHRSRAHRLLDDVAGELLPAEGNDVALDARHGRRQRRQATARAALVQVLQHHSLLRFGQGSRRQLGDGVGVQAARIGHRVINRITRLTSGEARGLGWPPLRRSPRARPS